MLKLKTVCEDYLQENFWLADNTKDTTRRSFHYLAQLVGNIEIDRLKSEHLHKYKRWLISTGREKTTANIYLRSLGPVLNWVIDPKELIMKNPLVGVKQFKVTRKPIRVYEDWEVQRMLQFADICWQGIILIGWTTGMRRGAILNLNMNNIRGGYIYVEPKRKTEKTWPWEPKDKEIRKIPMTDDVCQIIKKLNRFYPFLPTRTYDRMIKMNLAGLLSQRQRKCPNWNFRRDFVKIQKKAFGRQVGDFHSLRKTYTTRMCEVLPEHFVMRLTGHNSLKTMTYYLASKESYFEIARRNAQNGIKMEPSIVRMAPSESRQTAYA